MTAYSSRSTSAASPSSAANPRETMLRACGIGKRFLLHNQGSTEIPVFEGIDLEVARREAIVLSGSSGVGKSTFLRILYGNYRPSTGSVSVRHQGQMVDITAASPRTVLEVRRRTLGWVSQFLRVIPRVSALAIVMDPLLARGIAEIEAEERARRILRRLNLPERLWHLAPATFSGGEQQRVNIARSFVDPAPVLLIDEPTASLDAANRDVVVELISEAREAGSAVVGIFHDEPVRDRIATRIFDLTEFKSA